ENALRSALRGNPDLAEAHYTLGLLAEILGTGSEVDHLRQARKLDPKAYPVTPQMPRPDFEAVVSEALSKLPEPVRSATQNIPVLVAEVPHPADLTQGDPPLSPRILGLFVGAPPAETSTLDAPPVEQPTILLFKRNLERASPDRATLIEEIRVTVLHEVGHALGLSEDELHERGLE
ncbi:MAG: metallopeptidase family protein, partial [Deltaproteobacteria bacterium]|nr:metallopeptidase family protein [Deltaproteobacteria bacterium]